MPDWSPKKIFSDELTPYACMQNLSPLALSLLASVAFKKKIPSNQYIWEAGDPGDFFALIVSGLVEGTRHSQHEGETIISIFGPSDLIGLPAAIRQGPYPGSAKAISKKTEIIKFYIRPLIQSNTPESQEVQLWIRERLLSYGQILQDKIDILNAGHIENRVFELFHHLIRRFGEKDSNENCFIPIQLTRTQIARITNARVETVIRILSRWQKNKLIRWASDGIWVENLSSLEKEVRS